MELLIRTEDLVRQRKDHIVNLHPVSMSTTEGAESEDSEEGKYWQITLVSLPRTVCSKVEEGTNCATSNQEEQCGFYPGC